MRHRRTFQRPPTRDVVLAIAYIVTMLGMVVYINTSRAAVVSCAYNALAKTNEVTDARTKAADAKDRATLERVRAMRQIVDLRIENSTRHDATIEHLRKLHHDASLREERELERLIAIRKTQKPPDIREKC